jgi:hypothetical protein
MSIFMICGITVQNVNSHLPTSLIFAKNTWLQNIKWIKMMYIIQRTCLFHFTSSDCVVESVDTNIHAVSPSHIQLQLSFDVNIMHVWRFLSREVLSHCSSKNCIVESMVANSQTCLKNSISVRFYIFTVMLVMIEVFMYVMLCELVSSDWHFDGVCYLLVNMA